MLKEGSGTEVERTFIVHSHRSILSEFVHRRQEDVFTDPLKKCSMQHRLLITHSYSNCDHCLFTDNMSTALVLCLCFKALPFSFSPRRTSSLSCINEYLAADSGGNLSE